MLFVSIEIATNKRIAFRDNHDAFEKSQLFDKMDMIKMSNAYDEGVILPLPVCVYLCVINPL